MHTAIRRITHRAGEHHHGRGHDILASKVKKLDTSAPLEIGMAAGTDDEEAFGEGYGKAPELAVQAVLQRNRSQRWMEWRKRVPIGVCRSTSTVAKVKKERIALERDSGPRTEARKEDKRARERRQ